MYELDLLTFLTRSARAGDELVTHRFPSGVLGMALATDLNASLEQSAPQGPSVWSRVRGLLVPPAGESVRPVSIQPGTRLLLRDIAEELQDEIGVGWADNVASTEIPGASARYREGIRFSNGRIISLQRLQEGQRVSVLDSCCVEFANLHAEPLALAG